MVVARRLYMSQRDKVTQTLPSYLHAGYQIGNLYFRERTLERAEKCYRNLLAVNPHYQPACKGLGNLFLFRGLLNEAISNFENWKMYPVAVPEREGCPSMSNLLPQKFHYLSSEPTLWTLAKGPEAQKGC